MLDVVNAFNDALESINGELTTFAARLAHLRTTVRAQAAPVRPPRLVRSPFAATVRAPQGHQVRKAVSRA
ncbi:hypothetical protein [Streptomyces zhihengii]|uniref:hypothetical protein n=1 Tax=Streptomyces zhihengii TaxID=1818004 RepID=UPI0033BB7DDF